THYNWRAPVEPGSTKLTSPLTPFSPGTLRVFGPADVTEIELAPLNSGIQWVTPGHDFFVKTALAVGDREPCDRLPLTFKTDTPAVCSGPEGELTWPMSRSTDGAVHAQREGVCKLRVSADGARYFGPLSLSLFDLNAPEGLVLPVVGEVCSGEGATTCEWGRDGTLVCASGKWKRANRCTATQACDLADGCLDGIDCGACRDLRP
ncbi:MAG TPA: hypothetical protein VFQ61_06860, partial [Polyangiaceae bacterium]|nr:hypothetical protein [Polyangiaceae bacterium]